MKNIKEMNALEVLIETYKQFQWMKNNRSTKADYLYLHSEIDYSILNNCFCCGWVDQTKMVDNLDCKRCPLYGDDYGTDFACELRDNPYREYMYKIDISRSWDFDVHCALEDMCNFIEERIYEVAEKLKIKLCQHTSNLKICTCDTR